ncbi:MAG: hypothetical protein ACREKI_07305 [Gemmatimonadota bacterium]
MLTREIGRGLFVHPGATALGFNALAADGARVYLHDSQGAFPFYAVDAAAHDVRGFGAWGRGRGEIAKGLPVVLSVADGRIFAHALLESKLLVFGRDLALLEEYALGHDVPVPGAFHALSDTLGVYTSSNPTTEAASLARVYRLDARANSWKAVLPVGDYSDLPELEPLRRNPTLLLGPLHADRSGRIFWAHYYSSLRAGFAADGAPLFLRADPRHVRVPRADIRERRSVVAGDPERAAQGYLALASDDRNLYALYSGVELTRARVLAARAGRGADDLHLGEGRIVDVFEKADGSYRFSLTLPIWAASLAVDGRRLYVVTRHDAPRLLVYEKPRILDN